MYVGVQLPAEEATEVVVDVSPWPPGQYFTGASGGPQSKDPAFGHIQVLAFRISC